jgi:hypothetical protein
MKTSLTLANNQALLIASATFIPKITNDLFCRWSAYLIGLSDEANRKVTSRSEKLWRFFLL